MHSSRIHDIMISSKYSDDVVESVWIKLSNNEGVEEISYLAPLLIYTFDNSATEKKVLNLTADLTKHISEGFGIVLPGYSIGFTYIDDNFSLLIRLN